MGNITTSGSAAYKAGTNVSTAIPENAWTTWISGSEAAVNAATRYNWSDAFAGLNDDAKFIIKDTVDDFVAIQAISFDMSGYTSRIEAEDMINVLRDEALRNIQFLRDIKSQTFIIGA